MKIYIIGTEGIQASRIGLGCMRLTGLKEKKDVKKLIETAVELGINFFDHADIYDGGQAESVFGECLPSGFREQILIQTKCAIRPGCCYDFSYDYIMKSVEGSLRRLKTDYVDLLLLHRPDTLMEEEDVARAFEDLEKSGKVRCFGVSNQNAMQLELMNQFCKGKVAVNQLQFSIAHCDIIDSGINVNIHNDAGANRDGSVLEYCRLKGIRLQAWSPFQYGMFEGCFIGNEKFPELNAVLNRLAEKYDATPNAIAIAWILRHPAGIQPIVGTTSAERLRGICKADQIRLTREEWYELYLTAGKQLP